MGHSDLGTDIHFGVSCFGQTVGRDIFDISGSISDYTDFLGDLMTKSELLIRLDVLSRAIYETPDGGVGCCLHIVLDDGNFEREHVEWCLEHAQHGICREVAELLLMLSEEGRETAVGLGCINFLAVKESQIERTE